MSNSTLTTNPHLSPSHVSPYDTGCTCLSLILALPIKAKVNLFYLITVWHYPLLRRPPPPGNNQQDCEEPNTSIGPHLRSSLPGCQDKGPATEWVKHRNLLSRVPGGWGSKVSPGCSWLLLEAKRETPLALTWFHGLLAIFSVPWPFSVLSPHVHMALYAALVCLCAQIFHFPAI